MIALEATSFRSQLATLGAPEKGPEYFRTRLPRVVIGRMVFNVAVDAVIGAIPLLGDLFDFAWKANTRNLQLLERHRNGRPPTWRDWIWLWALLGALALIALGAVFLAVLALRALGVALF